MGGLSDPVDYCRDPSLWQTAIDSRKLKRGRKQASCPIGSRIRNSGRNHVQKSYGSRETVIYVGGEGDSRECGLSSSFSIGRLRPKATLLLAGSSAFSAFPAAVAIIRVISRAAVPVASFLGWPAVAVTSLHKRPNDRQIISLKLCSSVGVTPSVALLSFARPTDHHRRPPSPMSSQYQSSPRAAGREKATRRSGI